jgi:hypothetical protein
MGWREHAPWKGAGKPFTGRMTAYEMEKDKAKDPSGLLCFNVGSIRRSRYFVKYLYHIIYYYTRNKNIFSTENR